MSTQLHINMTDQHNITPTALYNTHMINQIIECTIKQQHNKSAT